MAATIARAIGVDRTRRKAARRLGSVAAETSADTWRTHARACTFSDGSGEFTLRRDGATVCVVRWNPETDADTRLTMDPRGSVILAGTEPIA